MDILTTFVPAFLLIFFIINPFSSLPVFVLMTRDFKAEETRRAARDAVLIAGGLAVIFLFGGNTILGFLGVTISSFKVAGGIVLGLFGIETVLGLGSHKNKTEERQVVTTLIATPLLTGPGLITTLIIMSSDIGVVVPLIAIILALLLSWLILDNSQTIVKVLGYEIIGIFAKVFGLFLIAMAVNLARSGLGV